MVLFGDNRNILFEDNVFNFSNVLVKGSSIDGGNRIANVYADGVDGLNFTENVFDYGGWNPDVPTAGPNLFSHNLYIQSNVGKDVVFRNNVVTRGASNGIQMRSGGLAEDNFFGRNAISLFVGYANPTLSNRSILRRNVVMEGETMSRGSNSCGNVCSPAVWGIDVADEPIPADYQAEVTCNVVAQRAKVKSRPVNVWDRRYEATSINAYIRAGFD